MSKTYFLFFILTLITFSEDFLIINLLDGKTSTYNFEDVKEIKIQKIVNVESVKISSEINNLLVNENFQLIADISPEDATNKKLNWSSSNEEVISIDQSGLISAISVGESTIMVTTEDGNYTDQIIISVDNASSVDGLEKLINLYPNPTHEKIYIDLSKSLKYEIILNDMTGKIVHSGFDTRVIDLSAYSSGSYLLTIIIDDNFINYQIIKN